MSLLDRSSGSLVPRTARVASAAWAAFALHVLVAAIVTFWPPEAAHDDGAEHSQQRVRTDLVWLQRPGAPTGGGRDGDSKPDAPLPAERPGTSRLTVPVGRPPSFTAAKTQKSPPLQEIDVPIVPQSAGLREAPGIVSPVVFSESVASHRLEPGSGSGEGDAGRGLDKGRDGNYGGGPAGTGTDVRPPELLVQVRPDYTSQAMLARIQGVVSLEAVVMPDGSVGEVRIIRSLDRNLGLDEQAIKAVRRWRFRPATKMGTAIPMFVSIEMTFSLR